MKQLQVLNECALPHTGQMRHAAFSLVELSIVLVILGLLVGGILGGQSLIRAAELRTLVTQRDQYVTAINTFQVKYNALPGDMTNATQYWGAQDGGDGLGTDCTASQSTTAATCNGDGNGHIFDEASMNTVGYEMHRAWQHLANAGLVSGTFTGVAGSSTAMHSLIGVNAPKGKVGGGGWALYYQPFNNTGWFSNRPGHVMTYGTETGWEAGGYTLAAAETYGIDSKIDDGKPATGQVFVAKSGVPNCITTAIASTSVYALSIDGANCNIVFHTGI